MMLILPARHLLKRASCAAMLLFARQSFAETSLREIVAEAQADVAYAHRAFGSKTEIFQQALHGLRVVDPQ